MGFVKSKVGIMCSLVLKVARIAAPASKWRPGSVTNAYNTLCFCGLKGALNTDHFFVAALVLGRGKCDHRISADPQHPKLCFFPS